MVGFALLLAYVVAITWLFFGRPPASTAGVIEFLRILELRIPPPDGDHHFLFHDVYEGRDILSLGILAYGKTFTFLIENDELRHPHAACDQIARLILQAMFEEKEPCDAGLDG